MTYSGALSWMPSVAFIPDHFQLDDQFWYKLSYTWLSRKEPFISRGSADPSADLYSDFIFRQLPRGNLTGNMLHLIFEQIDFSTDTSWERVVKSALRQFMPSQFEKFHLMLIQLISHTLQARISFDGQTVDLGQITRGKRISEFEFDFNLGHFSSKGLDDLSTENWIIKTGYQAELTRMMNGKIDLFFEQAGKYYILDWKSNYLGDKVEACLPAHLEAVMNENNFHLQYLIYTLAIKKYLEFRIFGFDYDTQFGGVIYLFLRGLRAGQNTGVFIRKPALKEILNLDDVLSENILEKK